MSYSTQIWLVNLHEDPLDIYEIEDRLIAFGEANELPAVIDALLDAFGGIDDHGGPWTIYRCDGPIIGFVCAEISRLLPNAHFAIRGVGEEMDDMWLVAYKDGLEVKKATFQGFFEA